MEPRASLSCRAGGAPLEAVSVAENSLRAGPKFSPASGSGRRLAAWTTRLVLGVLVSMAAAVAPAQDEVAADDVPALRLAPADRPTLDIEISGPLKTPVGAQASFALKITNNGATRLDKLLIVDDFDAGMKHEAGESPLEYELGALESGATKTIDLTFLVTATGKLRHRVEILRNDKVLVTGRATIEGSPAAGKVASPRLPIAAPPIATPATDAPTLAKPATRSAAPQRAPRGSVSSPPQRSEVRPAPKADGADAKGLGPQDTDEPEAEPGPDLRKPLAPIAAKSKPASSLVKPAKTPALGGSEEPKSDDYERLLTPGSSRPKSRDKAVRPDRTPAIDGEPKLQLPPEAEPSLLPGPSKTKPAASDAKGSASKSTDAAAKKIDATASDAADPATETEKPVSRLLPPQPGKLQPVPKKKPEPSENEDKKSDEPASRESKSSSLPGIERPYYMLREPMFSAIPAGDLKAVPPRADGSAMVWTVAVAGDEPAAQAAADVKKQPGASETSSFDDLPARGTGTPQAEREPPVDYGAPLVLDVSSLRKLDSEQPIWIDKKAKKFVVVQGLVCNRSAPLELLACVRGSKEHEAIISTPVKPSLCHAALLATGAESGSPAIFRPKYEPARGDQIDITLVWIDAKKQRRTAKAQDWVLDVRNKKAMEYPWVFAGSRFYRDPDTQTSTYLADAEGSLICVSNFTTAMLDLPVTSTADNDELLFQAYTERIPPIGTPVTIILTPKKAAAKPGEPVRVKAKPRRNAPSKAAGVPPKAAGPRAAEKPAEALPPQRAPSAEPVT